MRTIGCGEWGFRELPMEEHFRICAKLGFTLMEFGIGGRQVGRLPEAPDRATVREFHALGRAYGIDAPYCCIENDFTLPDPREHERALVRTVRAMADAARCGATHVRLFAGFRPIDDMDEPTWQRLLGAFEECGTLAERIGVLICVETHGAIVHSGGGALHRHTITTRADGLARLVRELPRQIAFNWDPGNCKAADPSDPSCKLDLLRGRIEYCHLKDWLPCGPGWRAAAPGDGDLDYAELLSRLDFRGPLLIEYEPTEDVETGLRRSLAYLHRLGLRHDGMSPPQETERGGRALYT
jgi:sugar phosphate isomerase/epimerase